jgi:hypothetical protein
MSQAESGIGRRAAAALGVTAEAAPDAVRAAFLRRLPADGFLPGEDTVAAALVPDGLKLE